MQLLDNIYLPWTFCFSFWFSEFEHRIADLSEFLLSPFTVTPSIFQALYQVGSMGNDFWGISGTNAPLIFQPFKIVAFYIWNRRYQFEADALRDLGRLPNAPSPAHAGEAYTIKVSILFSPGSEGSVPCSRYVHLCPFKILGWKTFIHYDCSAFHFVPTSTSFFLILKLFIHNFPIRSYFLTSGLGLILIS